MSSKECSGLKIPVRREYGDEDREKKVGGGSYPGHDNREKAILGSCSLFKRVCGMLGNEIPEDPHQAFSELKEKLIQQSSYLQENPPFRNSNIPYSLFEPLSSRTS